MMKAVLFPGQGSQKVGMAQEHYDNGGVVRELFDRANNQLGYSITDIMFNGPSEKLMETRYTQPAIFLHSVALFQLLDLKPDAVAGHSLGEFSALVSAGVIDLESGMDLVSLRGELMQNAGTEFPGSMAAIIGMDDADVEEICKKASAEVEKPVVCANYNSPGQLVISGDVEAVKRAVEIAKEQGCRLAKMLPVSGAFHSPLMAPALQGLKAKLDTITFSEPPIPVYSNVTAQGSTDPDLLKENVISQLTNPVRWTQTLQNMHEKGMTHYTEVGPGQVLQGLTKRTLKQAIIQGYE
ncbi:MAG: ACP S-malonyltransferase [Balneolaceae bacterium]